MLVPLPNLSKFNTLTAQREELSLRGSATVPLPTNTPRLESLLNQTWELVGVLIVNQLKELGLLHEEEPLTCRVWWCLTGPFAFLPIHAASPSNGKGMMDYVVSSYTPTVSALLRARGTRNTPPFQMLVVGQANTRGRRDLPGVLEEVEWIAEQLGKSCKVLQDSSATVDDVARMICTCPWVHFACHGVQDHFRPMESGLVMWKGFRLTLSHLAQSSLESPQFAFLSSCQSAAGSKRFPNEALHLTAGMQFVGFRSVIGTMWSVGDRDAPEVAKRVYTRLFKDDLYAPLQRRSHSD